jgi:hypothetical protein
MAQVVECMPRKCNALGSNSTFGFNRNVKKPFGFQELPIKMNKPRTRMALHWLTQHAKLCILKLWKFVDKRPK